MNIRQFLGFKDLFPEEEPLLVSHYLEGISRADLIQIALLFIHNEKYDEPQSYAGYFASGDNPHFAKYMLLRLKQLVEDKPGISYTFASNVTGLKLLQYIFAFPAISETTKNEAEIIENITKAVSLINQNSIGDSDLEKKGVNQDSLLSTLREEGDSDDFFFAKMFFCNQILNADFVGYPLVSLAMAQILKADYFFKFCETDSEFKLLLELFLKRHNCNDGRAYLMVFLNLIALVFDFSKKEGSSTIKIRPDDAVSADILSSISLKMNEVLSMEGNYDSLYFKDKPLIQVKNDEFYIINYIFVIENLYNSLKFNFNKINQEAKVINDFFSNYTTCFSEQFLFNTLIENCYKAYKYKLVEGGPGRCDYFVRNGNKIFLFECKDIEYASKIKQSDDFSEIKGYIWEKLVMKRGKPIGVGQLVRDIKDISDGTTTWEEYLPNNLQVFPILVLGKPIYSILGFNYMMNEWFTELLDQESIDSRIKINPLVVIDIDTLLLLEESLSTKKLKLEIDLKNYYRFFNKRGVVRRRYSSFGYYILEKRPQYIFSQSSSAAFMEPVKEILYGKD